ncbi:camp-dependent protein kinase regulatory subunit [Coemansia mojavensis]|nr:camp-dependent protein kinase regulatory subunit [Coemansia mojavensis]
MDSEKTTLNDTRAEHETEYNEVLSELREAVFRIRPSDVYQFCASYFDQKLAEQREGLLKLIDMNPGVLDAASTSAEQAGAAGEASNAAGRSQQPNEAPRETGPETSDSHDDAHVPGNVQPFAGRRFSVSAESMNPTTEPEYKKKFVPKTDTQKQRIREALDNNFLFKNMDEDSYRDVIDAMEEKHVRCGQSVIVQGGVGDYFYIVEYGSFDIFVRKGDAQPVKVATVEDSGSFGELALMYNAPRAATVTATSDATLWALDRITFRSLLMERTSRKRRLYERFLETVPLLKSLEAYERQKIADALESVTYEDKDTIVRQGDPGDDFFLIEQGSIRVYKTDDEGVSREYPPLTQGGYFGELALLDNQPRQATLIACGRTKCARMSKDAFDRLLGPVINIIRREAGNYTHIQSLTKS